MRFEDTYVERQQPKVTIEPSNIDNMVLNDRLVDSEEFTSNADLFSEIELISPAANQHRTRPTAGIVPQVTADKIGDVAIDMDTGPDADNVDLDTGMEGGFDGMDGTQLDAVSLDDCSDDEVSGDNPKDEDLSSIGEVSDSTVTAVDVTTDMDVEETWALGHRYKNPEVALPFRAGCAWAREDWSCAHDVVFMVFFHIYRQSSASWRNDWRRKSPGWTVRLADHFNLLLKASESPNCPPEELSKLFSSLRDLFRDKLSSHDQRKFRRRGHVTASVCGMLELLSGSVDRPSIDRRFLCSGCGMESHISSPFALLASSVFPTNHRRTTDPRFVLASDLLARFVQSLVSPLRLYLCGTCHRMKEIQSFSLDSPWIWFEVESAHTMTPSPTVSFRLPGFHLVYDLYSVIYLGQNHFTARVRGLPGEWWNYDGMCRFGAARHNRIRINSTYLNCNTNVE